MSFDSIVELKSEVSTALKSKGESEYAVVPFPQPPSASKIWLKFGLVVRTNDDSPVTYQQEDDALTMRLLGCLTCQQLYVYNGKQGTSSLNSHKCQPKVLDASSCSSLKTVVMPMRKPTAAQKSRMTVALSDMSAIDMRPFATVTGEGFRAAIQTALNIGFESSHPIDADELLPDQVTVKRKTKERKQAAQLKVMTLVQEHFRDRLRAGFTTDIWTEDKSSLSFMATTIHFIDCYFKLHSRVLYCGEFTHGSSHTAPAILDAFDESIKLYRSWVPVNAADPGCAMDNQIILKTDSASNNCGAEGLPSRYEWDPCMCHRESTALSDVFGKVVRTINGKRQPPVYVFYNESPLIFDCLDHVKALITYLKQSKINGELSKKTQQGCPTRWDDVYIMTHSVGQLFDEIVEKLTEKNKLAKIAPIDQLLLEEIVRFLVYFTIATKSLEPYLTPTLHLVGMWKSKLILHLQPVLEPYDAVEQDNKTVVIPPDSEEMAPIKRIVLKQLEEKFTLRPIHAAAALLHPKQKNRMLQYGFNMELVDQGMHYLKSVMRQVGPPLPAAINDKRAPISVQRSRRPPKRPKVVVRHLGPNLHDDDSSEDGSDPDEDAAATDSNLARIDLELANYMSLKLKRADKDILYQADKRKCARQNANVVHDVGLLPWWKHIEPQFPIVARAARSILCIPASSSMSECTFSASGNTISDKRSSLKPSTVDMLMFLRSNKDILHRSV
jgi:hypothetical protein